MLKSINPARLDGYAAQQPVPGIMLGEAMKYFFAMVLAFAVQLVAGCAEVPAAPPPKPAAATPATIRPSPKPVVTHHILVVGDSLTQGSPESSVTWPALVWPTLKVGIVEPVIAGEGGSGYVHPGNTGSTFGQRAAMYVSPQD